MNIDVKKYTAINQAIELGNKIMNSNGFIQLSLNFSVIKNGTKVRIDGYDCHQLLDLTNCIGVIYLYSQSTGDYLIRFPGRKGIVPDTELILRYRRQQLEIIPRNQSGL